MITAVAMVNASSSKESTFGAPEPVPGQNYKTLQSLKQSLKEILSSSSQDDKKVVHVFTSVEQMLHSCDGAEWNEIRAEYVSVLQYCLNVLILLYENGNKLLFECMSAKWINVLWACCKQVPQMRVLVVSVLSVPMLCFVLKSSLPLGPRKVMLDTLKTYLGHAPHEVRRNLFARNEKLVIKLMDLMIGCGDFNMQSACLRTGFYFAGMQRADRTAISQPLLKVPQVRQVFLLLEFDRFFKDTRFFLNMLNSTLGFEAMVFSIPCSSVFIGREQIFQPGDLSEFWVDFNYGSVSISMLYDQCQQRLSSGIIKSLTILRHNVKSVVMCDSVSSRGLTITLNELCSGFSSTKIKIVLGNNQAASGVDNILMNMFHGVYQVKTTEQLTVPEKRSKEDDFVPDSQVSQGSKFETNVKQCQTDFVTLSRNVNSVSVTASSKSEKMSVSSCDLRKSISSQGSCRKSRSHRKQNLKASIASHSTSSFTSRYFKMETASKSVLGTLPNIFTPPAHEVAESTNSQYCKASMSLFTKRKKNLFEYLSQKKNSLSGTASPSVSVTHSANDESATSDADVHNLSLQNKIDRETIQRITKSVTDTLEDGAAALRNASSSIKAAPSVIIENSTTTSKIPGSYDISAVAQHSVLAPSEAKQKTPSESSQILLVEDVDCIDSSQKFDIEFETKKLRMQEQALKDKILRGKTGRKADSTVSASDVLVTGNSHLCVSNNIVSEHFASSLHGKQSRVEIYIRSIQARATAMHTARMVSNEQARRRQSVSESAAVLLPAGASEQTQPTADPSSISKTPASDSKILEKTPAAQSDCVYDHTSPLGENHSWRVKPREVSVPETEQHKKNVKAGKVGGSNYTLSDSARLPTDKVITDRIAVLKKICDFGSGNDTKDQEKESNLSVAKVANVCETTTEKMSTRESQSVFENRTTLEQGSSQCVEHPIRKKFRKTIEISEITEGENKIDNGEYFTSANGETDWAANSKLVENLQETNTLTDTMLINSPEQLRGSDCTNSVEKGDSAHLPLLSDYHDNELVLKKFEMCSKFDDGIDDLQSKPVSMPKSEFLKPGIPPVNARKSKRLSLSRTVKNKCMKPAQKVETAKDIVINDSCSERTSKVFDEPVVDPKLTKSKVESPRKSETVTSIELKKYYGQSTHRGARVAQTSSLHGETDSTAVKKASAIQEAKCPQTKEEQKKRRGRKTMNSVEKTIQEIGVMIAKKVGRKVQKNTFDTQHESSKQESTRKGQTIMNKKRKLFCDASSEVYEVNQGKESSANNKAKNTCVHSTPCKYKKMDPFQVKQTSTNFDSLISRNIDETRNENVQEMRNVQLQGERKNRSNIWAEKLKQLPTTDTDNSFSAERKKAVRKRVRNRSRGKQLMKKAVVRNYEDESSGDGLPPLVVEVVPLRYKSFLSKGNKPKSGSFSPKNASAVTVYDTILFKNKNRIGTASGKPTAASKVTLDCVDTSASDKLRSPKLGDENLVMQSSDITRNKKYYLAEQSLGSGPPQKNSSSEKKDNCEKSGECLRDDLTFGSYKETRHSKHKPRGASEKEKKTDEAVKENVNINISATNKKTIKRDSFDVSKRQVMKEVVSMERRCKYGKLSSVSPSRDAGSGDTATVLPNKQPVSRYNLVSAGNIIGSTTLDVKVLVADGESDNYHGTNGQQPMSDKQNKKMCEIGSDTTAITITKNKFFGENQSHKSQKHVHQRMNEEKDLHKHNDGKCTNISKRVQSMLEQPSVQNSEQRKIIRRKLTSVKKVNKVTLSDSVSNLCPSEDCAENEEIVVAESSNKRNILKKTRKGHTNAESSRRKTVQSEVTVVECCSQYSQSLNGTMDAHADASFEEILITKKKHVTYGERKVSFVESSSANDSDSMETQEKLQAKIKGARSNGPLQGSKLLKCDSSSSRKMDSYGISEAASLVHKKETDFTPHNDKTTVTFASDTVTRNANKGIQSYDDSLEMSPQSTQIQELVAKNTELKSRFLDELTTRFAKQMEGGDWRSCFSESHKARYEVESKFVAGLEEDISVIESYQSHLNVEIARLDRMEKHVRSMMLRETQAAAVVINRLSHMEEVRMQLAEGMQGVAAAQRQRVAHCCHTMRQQLDASGMHFLRLDMTALVGKLSGMFSSLFQH